MGIQKTYKKYSCLASFGVIGSPKSNVIFTSDNGDNSERNICASGALDDVILWDVRKGEKVAKLAAGNGSEVICLAQSRDGKRIAAGYRNGAIKLWDTSSKASQVTLSGHKSSITCLSFDFPGARLVSGSQDTNVIVWDVVNECGLYRLKGHKGLITQATFMRSRNILISSSKDTFVKAWDLDTQHCFLTLVGHRSEVWNFIIAQNETRLITGSSDSELKVWSLEYNDEKDDPNTPDSRKRSANAAGLDVDNDTDAVNAKEPMTASLLGAILRQSKERMVTLTTDPSERYVICHGTDSLLEVYKLNDSNEIEKSIKKKRKKMQKKLKKATEDEASAQSAVEVKQSVEDELVSITSFKAKSKIKSCDVELDSNGDLRVLLLLSNNTISLHKCELSKQERKVGLISSIFGSGHRSDVRTLCFNSDATCILSGSAESVKLWNRSTLKCIRTMESNYALCSFFVPGDRHAVIGTKTGELQLFDIAAGTLLESVKAHDGAVWSIALAPDKKGFVSGSADHDVKFWEFELVEDESYSNSSRRLGMTHVKTLKMSDDVLAVKYSPDQRLLAVSLLDSTIKVFYADTLKFFLSLYGHKLPVLCMDISMDGTLLVSGSADKNVKLWGLDFGDCHKSIFAHDDSIMGVQFVSKTHYFFTVSKDKTVKYWDADKYDNIMTLKGHQAEVWCLAVTSDGSYLATGSHDKSMRVWQRTEELLVIEEEREQEREEAFEKSIAEGEDATIAGEEEAEVEFAGKKTVETMRAAERLMEAIEIAKEEDDKMLSWQESCKATGKPIKAPNPNPILEAYNYTEKPSGYVLHTLQKIKSSELEESLLVLPFAYVVDVLKLLNEWIKSGKDVELCSRCLFFILRVHHNEIVTNGILYDVMSSLQSATTEQIRGMKDKIGLNLAGLKFVQSQMEAKSISFFADATEKLKKKKAKITHFR